MRKVLQVKRDVKEMLKLNWHMHLTPPMTAGRIVPDGGLSKDNA
jgi:hypothetical protein